MNSPSLTESSKDAFLLPYSSASLFSMLLLSACIGSDPGIKNTYRTDRGIFNTRHPKAKMKVTKSLGHDLLYADDCAIVAHSKDDLQRLADILSAATKRFGLKISIKKTEVMFQPAMGSRANILEIKIDDKGLNNVDSFTYLSSNLSSSNSLNKEVSNASLRQVRASYGRLHKRSWKERGLKLETKCTVYRAVVLTVLLYGCESWALCRNHVKLLHQFHQRCLRRILNTKWYYRASNAKVLLQAQMPSIDALLIQPQLRWSGHLLRMRDKRLPKQLFYGELTVGHRPRGRPKLHYNDTLKKYIQKYYIRENNRKLWPQAGLDGGKLSAREQKLMTKKDKVVNR